MLQAANEETKEHLYETLLAECRDTIQAVREELKSEAVRKTWRISVQKKKSPFGVYCSFLNKFYHLRQVSSLCEICYIKLTFVLIVQLWEFRDSLLWHPAFERFVVVTMWASSLSVTVCFLSVRFTRLYVLQKQRERSSDNESGKVSNLQFLHR